MTDNTTDRAKILERIRKLLAMAADVSSPNEAAIAARRAKALMEEYNVAHGDVLAAEMTEADFERSVHGEAFYSFPGWLSTLALGVAKYCDVRVGFVYKRDPQGFRTKSLIFSGEKSDIAVCTYLYDYLNRSIRRLAEQHGGGRAERGAFRLGAVIAVVERLESMKAEETIERGQVSNAKALVLVNKKLAIIDKLYGRQRERAGRGRYVDERNYRAGQAAGQGLAINRALGSARGTKALGRS